MFRCIFERSGNIFIFKVGIVSKNLRPIGTVGEHIENIRDADSLASNTWPAAEHLGV